MKTPYPNQISEPSDASVYSTISAMLDDPMPPKLRAALFRLLPTLDGVVLRRGVTDQIGRRGVAFELLDRNERTQIILDPSSYRFLGSRIVVVRDYQRHGDAGVHKAGTTVQSSAVVASRIVDRAGDTR